MKKRTALQKEPSTGMTDIQRMLKVTEVELERDVQQGDCAHEFYRTTEEGLPICAHGCYGPKTPSAPRSIPLLVECFSGCAHLNEGQHHNHHAHGKCLACPCYIA